VKAEHDAVFELLEKRQVHEWWSLAKSLGGGLVEVRLRRGVQWRIMGCHAPNRVFVVVLVCNHKDNVYDPKKCLKTSRKRVKEIQSEKAKVIKPKVINCDRPQ
jgi:hypothetical protein